MSCSHQARCSALQAKAKLEADLEAPYAKMDEWVANLKELAVSWVALHA